MKLLANPVLIWSSDTTNGVDSDAAVWSTVLEVPLSSAWWSTQIAEHVKLS